MANLGSFTVDIRAGTATLQSDLGRANAIMERNAKKMAEVATKAGIAIGAGLAAGFTGVSTLVKQSINAADQLDELAQKLGVSASQLSSLGLAAQRGGVGLDVLAGGMVRLARGASDTAAGVGTARDAFAALGIGVKDADGQLKSSDVLLKEIAGQFAKFEDGAEKTALAVRIFGKSGADLIPTLNQGSEGIAEMQARAEALGIAISDDFAAQAGAFNDALDDAKNLVTGLGNDLAEQLLPSLTELANQFVDNGIKAREGATNMNVLATGIKGVIAVAATAKAVVEVLVNVFGAVFDSAVAVGEGLAMSFTESLRGLKEYQSALLSLDFGGAIDALGESLDRQAAIAETAGAKIKGALDAAGGGYEDVIDGLAGTMQSIFAPMEAVTSEIGKQGEAALVAAPALASLTKAETDLAKAQKDRDKVAKEAAARQKAYTDLMQKSAEEEKQWVAERRKATASYQQSLADLRAETGLLGLSNEARAQAIVQLQAERMARDQTAVSVEEATEAYKKLLTQYEQAAEVDSIVGMFNETGIDGFIRQIEVMNRALARGVDENGKAFSPERIKEMQGALAGLNRQTLDYATGAIGAGISSLQSLAQEGSSAYKKLETAQLALNVVSAIGAVLEQGKGDPYTAFARMAAMAVAVAALVGNIGFSGGTSGMSAAEQQATQGTGTVLGDSDAKSESILNAVEITANATEQLVGINRGMLRALQSLESGIGSASGMLARGAGTIDVGPLESQGGLLGLPTLGLANMIFGGKQELIDQGIRIMGGALNDLLTEVTVGAYNTVRTDGGWFSSDDIDTDFTDITDEFGAQFALIIESIATTVREGALALGLLPEQVEAAMAAYQVAEVRISLMDLSAEEQQAELSAVFSSIFDGLAASVVPFIEQFQQLGEGLGETLVRVATSVQVTQEAMLQLGFALDQTDPEMFAQIAVGLIELTGGIDEFISQMSDFVNNFAPEAHKFEVAQDALTRAFAQSGLAIPATRDAMWELMQSLDATTEEGREQIATILRLAGHADAYYSALEDQAEAAADAAQEAAEIAAEAAQRQLDAMYAYAETVNGINRQLYELSGATEFRQSLAAIQEQYMGNVRALSEQARAAGLAGARTEDLAAAMQLQARQVAALIRELEQSALSQADDLGLTPLAMLNDQIAALESSESAAARATEALGRSIEDVGRISSEVASAMLGDFGPLSGQAKADYALNALATGAIGLDAALNAGREVFASGNDFNRFFNSAIALASRQTEQNDATSTGTYVSPAMRELLKQQAELQAQAARSVEVAQAQDLAQTIADLSFARGEDFQTVIDSLGIDLETFLQKLGFTDDTQLGEYIAGLQQTQAESYSWFEQNVTADAIHIVAALNDLLKPATDPLLNPPVVETIPDDKETVSKSKSVENQDTMIEVLRSLLEEMVASREIARTIAGSEKSQADSLIQIAENGALIQLQKTALRSRGIRSKGVEAG